MLKAGVKRMWMYKAVGLFVFLVAPVLISQSNLPEGVSGIVIDEDTGRPVEGAFVVLRDYQQLTQSYVSSKWESPTAADGSFTFVVRKGCYDILVSANARFLPFAKRICSRAEPAERPLVLTIKLKADPIQYCCSVDGFLARSEQFTKL
jgi:hypothetical protein